MLVQNVLPLAAGLLALALGLWSAATARLPRWLNGGQRPGYWGAGMMLIGVYAVSLFPPFHRWSDHVAGPYATLRLALLLLGLILVSFARYAGSRTTTRASQETP